MSDFAIDTDALAVDHDRFGSVADDLDALCDDLELVRRGGRESFGSVTTASVDATVAFDEVCTAWTSTVGSLSGLLRDLVRAGEDVVALVEETDDRVAGMVEELR